MRALPLAALVLAGCTSANSATVATARETPGCDDRCGPEGTRACERVVAAVVTGAGEMVAVRAGSREVVLHRFAGDDVQRSVVARLACMGAPTLERRPDGVHVSCSLPPGHVRVPVHLATPAPARVTHDDAATRIAIGAREAVVVADACFAPKRDGLVTCAPAGQCFVYSNGQLAAVTAR